MIVRRPVPFTGFADIEDSKRCAGVFTFDVVTCYIAGPAGSDTAATAAVIPISTDSGTVGQSFKEVMNPDCRRGRPAVSRS